MSANIDWSKFDLVESGNAQPETTSNSLDWSQFDLAEPNKNEIQPKSRPLHEELIRQTGRGIRGLGSAAVGALGDLRKLGGDTATWAFQKAGLVTPEDIKKIDENEIFTKYFPTTENVKRNVDIQTKGYLKPETSKERIADTALGVVGSSLVGGKGALSPINIIPEAASGLALGAAEEAKLPPYLALPASIVSNVVTRGGIKATQQGPAGFFGELFRVSPQNIKNESKQAFQNLGIQPNLSAVSNSPIYNWLENRLTQSFFSKNIYDKAISSVDNQFKDAIERNLTAISRKKYITDLTKGSTEAGTDLKSELKRSLNIAKSETAKQYKDAFKMLPQNNKAQTSKTMGTLYGLRKKLSESKAPTASEKEMLGYVESLSDNLKKPNIQEMIATKRSLNDIIDYEAVGGVKQFYKGILNALNKDIELSSKKYPNFYKEFKNTEKNFSDNAKNLRNDTMLSILKNEVPENTLRVMNKPSGILKVENALGTNPGGKKVVDALKRYKVEELMVNKMKDSATGELQHGKLSSVLSNKDNDAMLRSLSPQTYPQFKNLQKASQSITEGFRKYYNPSKTANVSGDFIMSGLVVSNLLSLNPLGITAAVGIGSAPYVTAKLLTNPKFINAATEVGKASRGNSAAHFISRALKLIPFIREAEKEVDQDEKFNDRQLPTQ